MFAKRRLVPYEFKVAPVELSSKEMVCSEFREASPVDQFLFAEFECDLSLIHI